MIQRAKIGVIGHFMEFGLLYRLDIAYCDGTKCFLPLPVCERSFKNQKNAFLNDPKS